jgi:hypothetical protein
VSRRGVPKPRKCASIPHRVRRVFCSPKCPDQFWVPYNSILNGYCVLFLRSDVAEGHS